MGDPEVHQIKPAIKLSLVAVLFTLASVAHAIDIDDVQNAIFSPTCAGSGCHNGSQFPTLSAGVAFGNIVNVASGNQGVDYVEPGDPDASYIVRKVEGTGDGSRMPFGRPALSQANIDLLRDWITEGALEDDGAAPVDTDGDGVSDDMDAFPNDPLEDTDTDGDSVGDNADAFPNDSSETADSDGDSVGDNADVFPNDASETADTDGDMVGDNADAFPNDASETADSDGDMVGDNADEFPNDANEVSDADRDGIGDNADTDDDNDGMSDAFEDANGLDRLDAADADDDTDGDGISNLVESMEGTDIRDATSAGDACELGNSRAETDSALGRETRLYVANPGSNSNQQTFLRFVNNNDVATDVEVYGIDDSGTRSRKGALTFTLEPNESKQITAQDVEGGNDGKGLDRNLCDGQGKWQLRVRSANPIEVMGLIRTPDGFLTSLNDVVPREGDDNLVYFANPGSNANQQTFLRIVNRTEDAGSVTITGIDDNGDASVGTITFDLAANESKQMTAQDLENGSVSKGLDGNLDDGAGKWRLRIASTLDLEVMSLIRSQDGFLTNLSGMVDATQTDRVIYFANPASELIQETFLRIINTSSDTDMVTISGVDDSGNIAPGGDVMFELGAGQSKQMTASDLETGNAGKGLMGTLGDGEGRWRLTVSSSLDLQVMSLVRTPDGFLTNLSRTTPTDDEGVSDVWIFNPASNVNQRSSLRIVNNSSTQGSVTITAVDDAGNDAPNGTVTFNILGDSAMTITAEDLENGNADLITGSLGDGQGKWRLAISSDVDLRVQSLLETPTGFLTNLSRPTE